MDNIITCVGCGADIAYQHLQMSENVVCPCCGYGHLVTEVQYQDWDVLGHEYYPGHVEYEVS